nr:uncharacterized protein CTRU02_00806 [Colletotrichum truncatum]KAF6800401.1 hypothetical protein CTRU02_00806 [Colletotrichum truncatum]
MMETLSLLVDSMAPTDIAHASSRSNEAVFLSVGSSSSSRDLRFIGNGEISYHHLSVLTTKVQEDKVTINVLVMLAAHFNHIVHSALTMYITPRDRTGDRLCPLVFEVADVYARFLLSAEWALPCQSSRCLGRLIKLGCFSTSRTELLAAYHGDQFEIC